MTAPNTPTPELEPAAWEDEWGELSRHKPSINPSPLYDAATIAKLTAERDALREQYDNRQHWFKRAEAAEKELERIKAINVEHCRAVNTLLVDGARLESSNKLLSDALEPFAKAADQRQVMCDDTERVTWSAITVGDLRRAASALAALKSEGS